jgi:iron uptake system component EfeO
MSTDFAPQESVKCASPRLPAVTTLFRHDSARRDGLAPQRRAAAPRTSAAFLSGGWPWLAAGVAVLLTSLLAGCGSPAAASGATGKVTITAKVCGAGWQHPTAGVQTLQVRNATSEPVEITLIGAESGDAYAKLEGVGPGTTRAMPVDIGSGVYAFDCEGLNDSNRVGPTIRVPGHIRGGVGIAPVSMSQLIAVTTKEEAYIAGGLATLARQTAELAAQVSAGQLASARRSWLTAHLTFERLGSAYGMFGPYDQEINGTPYGLAGGVSSKGFTGFYRLEYGLWHGQSSAELTGPAEQLSVDARSLETAWPGMQLDPEDALSDLALRTHEVLENAMQFQLSGQDNFGSGTNMAMVAAGIDATRAQLAILQPLLVTRYQDLPALYEWLNRLQQLVDATDTGQGWTPVSDLSVPQREQLDSAAGETIELLAEIPPMFEAKPLP